MSDEHVVPMNVSSELDDRRSGRISALYVVATPIGNLDDISVRATKILAGVDLVAAEDTRHSRKLLQCLGIQKPMLSLHEYNERERCEQIISRLQSGQSIALISDAGTPLISDPGYVLVRAVADAGLAVVPVPGACAAIAGLSAAGLPTDRFAFEGFLPAKSAGRKERLLSVCAEARTLVFYESPHRVLDSLADMALVLGGDRPVVVARELTKAFETFYRGTLAAVLVALHADAYGNKGEFVIMVAPAQPVVPVDGDEAIAPEIRRLAELLVEVVPLKVGAKLLTDYAGGAKNNWYQTLLSLRKGVD